MNLGAIGTIVSLLVTLLFGIGSVIGIRQRRLSKEAQDLRELREMNLEAMRYIYQMEMTLVQINAKYGEEFSVKKPDILKKSYLEQKGATDKNNEFQQVAKVLGELGKRSASLGGNDE